MVSEDYEDEIERGPNVWQRLAKIFGRKKEDSEAGRWDGLESERENYDGQVLAVENEFKVSHRGMLDDPRAMKAVVNGVLMLISPLVVWSVLQIWWLVCLKY